MVAVVVVSPFLLGGTAIVAGYWNQSMQYGSCVYDVVRFVNGYL